jgi:ATP-binding protein involved in chromosome partitioning
MKTYSDIVGDGGSDILGQVSDIVDALQKRLSTVTRVLAVTSGKGGVGKSTVTVQLAAALAHRGWKVGILDADINGASVVRMTGVTGQSPKIGAEGVSPAIGPMGIKVMAMDLFLPEETAPVAWDAHTQQDAFTWRQTLEMTALREMLIDTHWGKLDVLLLDLPPGGDRLPNISGLLPEGAGALTVTIPTRVSHTVVERAVRAAKTLVGAEMLGIIDNMASHVCGHCGEEETLFPGGDSRSLAERMSVPHLGEIPFEPRLAAACDAGEPLVANHPDTPTARAFDGLAETLSHWIQMPNSQSAIQGDTA